MGYKIWRKDSAGWYLAFDVIFCTKEQADEQVLELNAQYADKVRYGEISFFSYREDIKLSKDGSIIDPMLPANKPKSKPFNNNRRKVSRNVHK